MTNWTTPITWDVGRHITSNDLNAQIRDNLLVLGEGSGAMVEALTTYYTSSTVITNMGNLALTLPVRHGGRVLVAFAGSLTMGTSVMTGSGNIWLYIDGTHYPLGQVNNSGLAISGWVTLLYLTQNLSISSHDIRMRWSVTSTDNTVRLSADANTPARLIAVEL